MRRFLLGGVCIAAVLIGGIVYRFQARLRRTSAEEHGRISDLQGLVTSYGALDPTHVKGRVTMRPDWTILGGVYIEGVLQSESEIHTLLTLADEYESISSIIFDVRVGARRVRASAVRGNLGFEIRSLESD